MKVIIIGGVAGGMSAATRLRRLKEDAEIIVYEKGSEVSFANCGLPYHVSGEIKDFSELVLQTPEALKKRFNLDVRTNSEVIDVNPKQKTVTVQEGDKRTLEHYDKLILSPGAVPFVPETEGLQEAKNIYSLRNLSDLNQIMEALKHKPNEAVVIGAGFIGLEMVENLRSIGMNVTLIEKAPYVLPLLDEEMSAYIKEALIQNGVKVITSQSVTRFENQGQRLILEDGTVIYSDLTLLSIGVRPDSKLAKKAGIKLGINDGILVDSNYQTSQPDIYAVGDAMIVKQQITGEDSLIALASPANRQGRQVADNIAGQERTNRGSLGTAIVRVFHLTAASTGLNERTLQKLKKEYQVVHVNSKDHASYYPNATELTLKLLFNPSTGDIYGAQGVGEKGLDKRMDVISTAIKGGLTIFDLPELELSYAPPFGSAKDAVNMLGYAAINLSEGLSDSIQWYELEEALESGYKLLDVRHNDEIKEGSFKNYIHIPIDMLRDQLETLSKNQSYIVSCRSGQRSYIAERLLSQSGFNVKNLDGGFSLYQTVLPKNVVLNKE